MLDASLPETELCVLLDSVTIKAGKLTPEKEWYFDSIIGAAELIEHAMLVAKEQERLGSPHQRIADIKNFRDELLAIRSRYTAQRPDVPTFDLLTAHADNQLELEELNEVGATLDAAIALQVSSLNKFLAKDGAKDYESSRKKTQRLIARKLVGDVLAVLFVRLGLSSGSVNSEMGKITGVAVVVKYALTHSIRYNGGIDWLKRIYLEGKPKDSQRHFSIYDALYNDLGARQQN